jgi:GDP-L-fucose synthase
MKYLITGGSGLLGNAFKSILPDAIYPNRSEMDCTNFEEVSSTIGAYEPDVVIHLAAKVGGVQANMNEPFMFYHLNSVMNNNIMRVCSLRGVPKLVSCLSTCIYPSEEYVEYPLTENQLHAGPPHESNFGYAYAKRMVDIQTKAIRKQYRLNYISVIPNNMYGEHDNFDLTNGHVIPALMRKIWEAKINNQPSFEVWGDGEVYREFTYAKDIAKAIKYCVEHYTDEDPINIGNSSEYLLKDVIMIVKRSLGYEGDITFDISKPKGQIRKPSSNKKLIEIGYSQNMYTDLEYSLEKTCKWFKKNYPNVRGVN